MFKTDKDGVIHLTRGDIGSLSVTAVTEDGQPYVFKPGDVVRFSVCERKNCKNVVMECNTAVTASSESVDIVLEAYDTDFGDIISKPVQYWYEIVLNPDTAPQTIVPYDEDGARVLILYPGFSKRYDVDYDPPVPPEEDEPSEPVTVVAVGVDLKGLTVHFEQTGGVIGTGYEPMFTAGDFSIFSEDDYYQISTPTGEGFGSGTGYFDAFSYTFPTDKSYVVDFYDTNALTATIVQEDI